ncbi:hypothetical protein K470DRAFT_258556 [Piedraia hortae CBS 480.64]|uniref:Uncharacterized protein n=1 Tax=Piedraia hortae CBS 480.64 TaxID=1314780 RepID=A0A6A7BWV0_9PEZI|nr:hypothetical protein K470DRAFT_258556 [Piedraia hortae CBS 480.64]
MGSSCLALVAVAAEFAKIPLPHIALVASTFLETLRRLLGCRFREWSSVEPVSPDSTFERDFLIYTRNYTGSKEEEN